MTIKHPKRSRVLRMKAAQMRRKARRIVNRNEKFLKKLHDFRMKYPIPPVKPYVPKSEEELRILAKKQFLD